MKIIANNPLSYNCSSAFNQDKTKTFLLNQSISDKFCSSQNQVAFGRIEPVSVSRIVANIKQNKLAHSEKMYSILQKFRVFNIEEFNKLTEEEKLQLRAFYPFPKSDFKNIMRLHKTMEKSLNKKFPNGYIFVSIGRSPSIFAKILEFEGKESKICPISYLRESQNKASRLSSEKVSAYGDFMKEIGISKETVANTDKPFVFVDYTDTGTSLNNFKDILARDEIGIKEGKNAVFLSLNKDLLKFYQKSLISKYYDGDSKIKYYSPAPMATLYQFVKSSLLQPQSRDAKLMQFHIIDYLSSKQK